MANKDLPCGAVPHGRIRSLQPYVAGGTVYPGDFVKLDATGRVVVAAAGDTLLGVCSSYGVAADPIMVSDHPEQRYIVQASGTEVDAQTDIGNNADILATAGDSTYRVSRHELDSSTLATSAAQLTILGVEPRIGDAFGAQVKCLVRINEHQVMKDAFAGI